MSTTADSVSRTRRMGPSTGGTDRGGASLTGSAGPRQGHRRLGHHADHAVVAPVLPFREARLLQALPDHRAALAPRLVAAALLLGLHAATSSGRRRRSWSGNDRRTILRTTVPNCLGSGPLLYGMP